MKPLLLAAVLSSGAPQRHAEKVSIPTRVELRRDGAQISIRFDPTSYADANIERTAGLTLGTESQMRWRQGGAWHDGGLGLQSGPPTSDGASLIPRSDSADVLEVEIHFQIFETDIPPQHHWMPRSGTYRVLGEWTVKGTQKAP